MIRNKAIINITRNAWKKINHILKKSNNDSMLFSAESGGCNGFNYNLQIINKNDIDLSKFSYVQKKSNKVFVDPLTELYLIGTTIDYTHEDFTKGIYESKFIFTPDKNKASTCGCGVSFSPKI